MPLHAYQSADVCTVCIITSAALQRVINTLSHCPVFLLTTLSYYGCKAAYLLLGYSPGSHSSPVAVAVSFSASISGPRSESPHPRCPVQSAHHWKSKRRQNFDIAESLRHNREPSHLQVWSIGCSKSGMCSFPTAISIPS